MSTVTNLAAYRAQHTKPERHVLRVIFNFDHDIAHADMAAMMDALRKVGRGDIADRILYDAVVVMP